MKTQTSILIILISLLLITLSYPVNATPNSNHYIVVGHIYPEYISDYVTLRNQATDEELTVSIIECNHNIKEYLFDIANLKQGWNNGDILWLFYGNESKLYTIEVKIDDSMAGIQADFNRPPTIPPEAVVVGTILILVGSGYYYIKRIINKK